MVLGMASRVTLGHSGRPLVLDQFSWWLFIGFQAAVAFRIAPDILPEVFSGAGPGLYVLGGLCWLICFSLWTIRYAPIYGQERADGKPG
jgi:uncharacterized protein involved in response to NO